MVSKTNREDFLSKIEKIRKVLKDRQHDGVIINNQFNFSWLCGGRGFIGLASEIACASFVIKHEGIYLLTNNIESIRLADEEISELIDDINIKTYYWYDDSEKVKILTELFKDTKYETDNTLENEFKELRSQLSKLEIEKYRWLGKNTAKIVENVCKNLIKGITENFIAGEISKELWIIGIEPVTLLIAFDERINKYRHPLPTNNILNKCAMIAVCVRKWGLYVSLTRFVYMDKIPKEIIEKQQAVTAIDTSLIVNTRPTKKINDIFDEAVSIYKKTGFEKEWKLHHQGGLTGYQGREIKGTTKCLQEVKLNQAFAWNPSIMGTKSEDTILILEKGNEIITQTGEYKYLEIEYNGQKILRPDIFCLNK